MASAFPLATSPEDEPEDEDPQTLPERKDLSPLSDPYDSRGKIQDPCDKTREPQIRDLLNAPSELKIQDPPCPWKARDVDTHQSNPE